MPAENQPLPLRQALQSISDSIRDGALLDMAAVDALNEHLASPAQHQGEPVTLPERTTDTESCSALMKRIGLYGAVNVWHGGQIWNACLDEIAKLGPLYTRPVQGEPVAHVYTMEALLTPGSAVRHHVELYRALPSGTKLYTHADTDSLRRSWQAGYDTAWYAKNPAEKRTSVNADPGEVERLREQVETLRLMTNDYLVETERLRAQLKTQTLRADAAVGDANEAERKLAERDAHPMRALSQEAYLTLVGMVEFCLNQRVCMGMDEGFKSFDPEEEHDFVKELRSFVALSASAEPEVKP